jgi:hypothetical protein
MLDRLWLTFGFILVAILIYGFRRSILATLSRFDRDNRERIEQERRDRTDALAHFRHTLGRAEEQVEAVQEIFETDPRTGTSVTRFVFEGERFSTRVDAERVRAEKIRALARAFYQELPTALSSRGDGRLR